MKFDREEGIITCISVVYTFSGTTKAKWAHPQRMDSLPSRTLWRNLCLQLSAAGLRALIYFPLSCHHSGDLTPQRIPPPYNFSIFLHLSPSLFSSLSLSIAISFSLSLPPYPLSISLSLLHSPLVHHTRC